MGFKNLEEMDNMFKNCISLNSVPDISKWNLKNVNVINNIFKGCKKSLNIPLKFN